MSCASAMIMLGPGTDVFAMACWMLELWASDRLESSYDMSTVNQVLAADTDTPLILRYDHDMTTVTPVDSQS